MQNDKNFRPDRIGAYFRIEWLPLALVTVSGLIYNIGLLATPWFEGRLAQCLADILDGSATAAAMAILVLTYVLVTLVVQAARRGIPTVGVGDGGNEIGMGNVAHVIARRLALEPCVVTVDNLVVATVSNWGAYGIVAAMGRQAQRPLLPAFDRIGGFYRFIVDRGSVDGTTGRCQLTVDGFSMETERHVVESLLQA